MEGIIGMIIQIIAGAIGGNAAGAAAKKDSLGTAGNSIGGAVANARGTFLVTGRRDAATPLAGRPR
jgi:hypothetical protein